MLGFVLEKGVFDVQFILCAEVEYVSSCIGSVFVVPLFHAISYSSIEVTQYNDAIVIWQPNDRNIEVVRRTHLLEHRVFRCLEHISI